MEESNWKDVEEAFGASSEEDRMILANFMVILNAAGVRKEDLVNLTGEKIRIIADTLSH